MSFFDEYFSDKSKKDKKAKPKVLDKLYQIPKKDKGLDAPTFGETIPNQVHQADILYLPEDDGYKYALVVTDDATRITDAVPLKSKSNEEVLRAFKTIYDRGILILPRKVEVDPGTEFKGSVTKWFRDQNIIVRVGKVGRHRQMALVERRNQIIGTAIHKR